MAQDPLRSLSARGESGAPGLLRALLDSLPDLIYVKDTEGRYVFSNSAHAGVLGAASPEEVVGKTDFDFYPRELAERYRADEREIVRSGQPLVGKEEPGAGEEGDRRWRSTTRVPLRDDNGEIVGLVSITRDVTERKEAEEALRESEERYRRLVEESPETIAVLSEEKIVYINAAGAKLAGADSPEELIGKPYLDFVHPDFREVVRSRISQAQEGKSAELLRERLLRPDGSTVEVEAVAIPTTYEGKPAVYSVVRDITGRKEAEDALRKSRARFQAVFENAAIGITLVDMEGRLTESNPAMQEMLGYGEEELRGMKCIDITHPDDVELSMRHFERLVAGELGYYQIQKRYVRKDGRVIWSRLTGSVICGAGGESRLMVGMVEDITERKRAKEELRDSERKYRLLMEQASDGIFIGDRQGNFIEVNPRACEMLGYTREELLRLSVKDIIAAEDLGEVPLRLDELRSGETLVIERRLRRADGTLLPVETSAKMLDDGRLYANVRDITERKRAEEALRRSERNLATAQQIARVGSWEYDVEKDEVRWSDEAYRIFGFSPQQFVPTRRRHLEFVHPEDRELVERSMLDPSYKEGRIDIEYRIVRPNGEVRIVQSHCEVDSDEAGKPTRITGTIQDITERKALEQRLEHQAFHDSLTDLPNRALFLDRLEHALARARREGGTIAVFLVDLDDFKLVNDSLGHDAGNVLLVEVAERLCARVRPGDTVARLSGDEFIVLLEAPAGVEEARRVAERIREHLQAPIPIGGREVFVRSSIGIALGETEEQPEEVLRHADLAMYVAKSRGKDRYELYEPGMDTWAQERMYLESDLRWALEREEFEVHYQPIVELGSGRISGFEALARWRHPERGMVASSEFIQLAEETGLIRPIGRLVIEEACRQARLWRERHPDKEFLMSVNLSVNQFNHQSDLIPEILDDAGLDPRNLQLEITERAVMDDAEFALSELQRLKGLGVSFAIDDYGMGYSSLYYLKRAPVDFLKIDQLFISGLGKDPGDAAIVSGTIGLGHALGLKVVAEGVETEEQLAKLKELGCDLAQGRYFTRPLPGEAAERLLVEGVSW